MTARISGTVDVKLKPQAHDDNVGDPEVGRKSIDKRFHGDLDATSEGQMVAVGTDIKGSAGYVAIERISGTLGGRNGIFALQHRGTTTRGNGQPAVTFRTPEPVNWLVSAAK